ncbi:ankyrin repeat domain-containing protein 10 isoform X1 [Lates japonicus]|uniref:Ankyrin repeat domain-containing protein 10 isoform X1 n=1 Tax=Lates japonicus TaxID=270547 RepID=A0AAD3N3R8_LATJO|nr:ankyrin repeat domain-containing protein 10 isoform X1 [Lates japonicus]
MGTDCGDFQHYGHYHGFGDTAEELSDSSHLEHSSSVQAEHRYNERVVLLSATTLSVWDQLLRDLRYWAMRSVGLGWMLSVLGVVLGDSDY